MRTCRPLGRVGSTVLAYLLFGVIGFGSSGCATIVSSVSEDFAAQLSAAILNSSDIETVRDGAPAYLILIDGLLGEEPQSAGAAQPGGVTQLILCQRVCDRPCAQQATARKGLGVFRTRSVP